MTTSSGMCLHAEEELAEKVAALSCAAFYKNEAHNDEVYKEAHKEKEGGGEIVGIETHMSWIFLTPKYAYKLKKPVCSSYLDFSTLAGREYYCREELRLNRRLAPSVYLDVVPLRRMAGEFRLGGTAGDVVDYLVKMVRLPAERMLDRALVAHTLQRGELRAVIETLAAFYRRAQRIAMTPAQYRARFTVAINENRAQLHMLRYGLPGERIARVTTAQLDYVANADELAARAARIVDAHGDLRPEHICLVEPLQIIDCLEFQGELRQLDPLDELAFLAMECGRFGAPRAGRALLRMYRILSGDNAAPAITAFYRSHRALTRAVLAIWHLDDPTVRAREQWRTRALAYIELAEEAAGKMLEARAAWCEAGGA